MQKNIWMKLLIAGMLINAIGAIFHISRAQKEDAWPSYILGVGMIIFVIGLLGLVTQVFKRKPSH